MEKLVNGEGTKIKTNSHCANGDFLFFLVFVKQMQA